MLLVLVFGSFGVCVFFCVCTCAYGEAHSHKCTHTHTHTSASHMHTPLPHPHTFLLHTDISTPGTHKALSHVLHVVMGVGGRVRRGPCVCVRSVPSSPDIAPCSKKKKGHTGQRGFFGLLDRNIAQALRQHTARRFIFYSESSEGVLFEARF